MPQRNKAPGGAAKFPRTTAPPRLSSVGIAAGSCCARHARADGRPIPPNGRWTGLRHRSTARRGSTVGTGAPSMSPRLRHTDAAGSWDTTGSADRVGPVLFRSCRARGAGAGWVEERAAPTAPAAGYWAGGVAGERDHAPLRSTRAGRGARRSWAAHDLAAGQLAIDVGDGYVLLAGAPPQI